MKALREAKSATLLKQEAEEFLGIGRRALRELERAGLLPVVPRGQAAPAPPATPPGAR
jgi:hypothetical protein